MIQINQEAGKAPHAFPSSRNELYPRTALASQITHQDVLSSDKRKVTSRSPQGCRLHHAESHAQDQHDITTAKKGWAFLWPAQVWDGHEA